MLFGELAQVIQVEWQGLAAAGATIAGAIVAAAKLLARQMEKMHSDNRADAREARDENRALSTAILNQQAQTVQVMTGMQTEIRHVLDRLGECEADLGAKPISPNPKKPPDRR